MSERKETDGGLARALEEAALGDLLTVEVAGHGSVVLAARVDENGGGLLWEPFQDDPAPGGRVDSSPTADSDELQEQQLLAAHMRTKLWVAPMLRDTERNAKYAKAVARAVHGLGPGAASAYQKAAAEQGAGQGRLVLDVGTGTGLLAMLAARVGAEKVCFAGGVHGRCSKETSACSCPFSDSAMRALPL